MGLLLHQNITFSRTPRRRGYGQRRRSLASLKGVSCPGAHHPFNPAAHETLFVWADEPPLVGRSFGCHRAHALANPVLPKAAPGADDLVSPFNEDVFGDVSALSDLSVTRKEESEWCQLSLVWQ